MARMRSSSSPVDREILGLVAQAERSIRRALDVCGQAKRESRSPGSHLRYAHVQRTKRDLLQVMGALSSIRRVVPLYETEDDRDLDPDMMTAEERKSLGKEPNPREALLQAIADKITSSEEDINE